MCLFSWKTHRCEESEEELEKRLTKIKFDKAWRESAERNDIENIVVEYGEPCTGKDYCIQYKGEYACGCEWKASLDLDGRYFKVWERDLYFDAIHLCNIHREIHSLYWFIWKMKEFQKIDVEIPIEIEKIFKHFKEKNLKKLSFKK